MFLLTYNANFKAVVTHERSSMSEESGLGFDQSYKKKNRSKKK